MDFVIFIDFYIFIISLSLYYLFSELPMILAVRSHCCHYVQSGIENIAGQTMAFTDNKRGCKLVYISLIKHVMLMTVRRMVVIINKFLSLLKIILKHFIIMFLVYDYTTCLVDVFTCEWINIIENNTKCSFFICLYFHVLGCFMSTWYKLELFMKRYFQLKKKFSQ